MSEQNRKGIAHGWIKGKDMVRTAALKTVLNMTILSTCFWLSVIDRVNKHIHCSHHSIFLLLTTYRLQKEIYFQCRPRRVSMARFLCLSFFCKLSPASFCQKNITFQGSFKTTSVLTL